MKIFLDTANLEEIKEAISWGVINGVTTNPSIIAREKNVDYYKQIEEICKIVDGPVHAMVTSRDLDKMVEQARKLRNIAPNVVIKIPLTFNGLKAIKILKSKGITTNATVVYSATQALLAVNAGASYVSPFYGRIEDLDYENVIKDIVNIFKNYNYQAEILTASVRLPIHLKKAALAGADIATVPLNVLRQIIMHPSSDIALTEFLNDWEKGCNVDAISN